MKKLHYLLASLILFMLSITAHAETWKVTSLEWPPFAGEKLPDGGSGVKALREALKSQGIELQVEFYPWTRAIETARQPGYAGFFPAWPEDAENSGGFSKSPSLFQSPLVIVQNKDAPIDMVGGLDALNGKKIAVVQDYGNTREFNDRVKAGTIKGDVGVDDLVGLKKLEAKRVDGAIVDVNVMHYILATDLKSGAASLAAASGWEAPKDLLLAVNDANPDKARILETLTKALAAVNTQQMVDEANKSIFAAAGK